MFGLPKAPRSPWPMSSARTMTIFGGGSVWRAPRRTADAATLAKSTAARATRQRFINGPRACGGSIGVRLPAAGEMLGRPPGKRLCRQRRIVAAARAHHRRTEKAEVGDLVRKAPAIDDVGFGVVTHARA